MTPLANPKVRIGLRWGGYVLGYLTALVVFFYVTFPFEPLKQRIIASYAATQTGSASGRLEIDDLSWAFSFPGVVAHGVRMITPAALAAGAASSTRSPGSGVTTGGAGPQAVEAQPKVITLERVSARVSPVMWLFGTKDISFSADGLGGEIEGNIVIAEKGREYLIELHDVSPGQLPIIAETVGLPLKGTVNGALQLSLPEGKAALAQGELTLNVENLEIGDGKAKVRNTLAIPTVQVGTLEIKASVTSGQLKIETFKANGPDLELEAEGKVRLRDRVQQSSPELLVRFSFTDQYKGKSEVTKAIFGDPKSNAPGLFDLDPTMKRAKQSDGSYNWSVVGTFDKLRYTPTSQRIGTQRTSPAAPAQATARKPSSGKAVKPEPAAPSKLVKPKKSDAGM